MLFSLSLNNFELQNNIYFKSLIKRVSMELYQSLSCFNQQPSQAIRFLIKRNLDQLVILTINEVIEFTNKNEVKSKALDQLKYTLLIGQSKIKKHTENIIKSLVKISHNSSDIPMATKKINQIVEIVGYFVDSEYYIPLVINILGQQQYKNSGKNTIILLNILGHMLLRSEGLQDFLDTITASLSHYESQFYENDEGLVALFDICHTLLKRLSHIEEKHIGTIFQIILNVEATKSIAPQKRQEASQAMQLLAIKGNFGSVAQLHANQIGPIITNIIKTKEYTQWIRTSKNRFKFDTIVRNCSSLVAKCLEEILTIIQFMVNPQNDLQIRMDTLVLIEFVIAQTDLRQSLAQISEQLLKKVLIVAIQWKVGKPQIKIRKAGVINIINLIDNKIISQEQLLFCFKDLIPHLKNCLNDDWAPELRLASSELLQKYLLATKQTIGDDELRQIYPYLLERLDDSQDPIRIKITGAINVFFSCRYIKLSESTFQYMVGTIFIHFDDQSQEIRSAIYSSLKLAAIVNPTLIQKQAEQSLSKMHHKQYCRELIQICKERIQDFQS